MLPVSVTGAPLLVATADAKLFIWAHACAEVAAVTTAVTAEPAETSPKLQFNTCVPTGPVMLQPAEEVCHVTPPPAGSESVNVTAVAGPGPLFVTTMVKVAVCPAVIVLPSGVLAIESTGIGTQVMRPLSLTGWRPVAVVLAVFGSVVHACTLVTALTTAVNDAPGARVPTLQC